MRRWAIVRAAVFAAFAAFAALPAFGKLDKADVVGYWPFDSDAGGKAADASGNKNDGTIQNGPALVEGKFGKSFEFSAGKSHAVKVKLPHMDTLSVVMWARYSAFPSANPGLLHVQAGEIENVDPASKTVGIWVSNGAKLWGRIIPKGAGNVNLPQNGTLEKDKWHHVALVVDAASKKAIQYLDGAEVGAVDYPGVLTPFDSATIGRQANESWEGAIDEVAIFRSALTPADIQSVMKGIEAGLAVDPLGKAAVRWASLKTEDAR